MTAKLPPTTQEATYFCNKCGYFGQVGPSHSNCSYHATKHGPFWNEGAVLQAVRDALERAAKICDAIEDGEYNGFKRAGVADECAFELRALLKEYK